MQAACDEVVKVVKKQKTCSSKTSDVLERLITAVAAARQAISSGTACSGALQELAATVEQLAAVKELNSCTKDLHASISKLGKVHTSLPAHQRPRAGCRTVISSACMRL